MRALLGLVFLGAALKLSRGSESFGGFGTIPPKPPFRSMFPSQSNDESEEWVRRTFAPGTPVVAKEDFVGICGDEEHRFPPGTRCVVTKVVGGGDRSDQIVHLRCNRVIEGFVTSETITCDSDEFGWMMDERFRPLVDNWGPLVVPSKKSYKAGWAPKASRYKGRP